MQYVRKIKAKMNVEDLILRQDPGVDVVKLRPNTKIIVKTEYSTYVIITTNILKEIFVQGGEYVPKLSKGFLTGSTYGGSCLKMGWIGLNMHLEIHLDGTTLTTSVVKNIRVIDPNKNWHYDIN